jgi:hypothetical protein
MLNFINPFTLVINGKKNIVGFREYIKININTMALKNKSKHNQMFIPMKASVKELIDRDNEIWEIDFFSRPVLNNDGKKLWELIVVNKNDDFLHIETVPNNLINSKELRKRIRQLIESAPVKPKVVKFFRVQMFNMISIALSDLDIVVKPSRRTYSLLNKIKEREENVYPKMEGYKSYMRDYNSNDDILKKTPEKMPDALRGEQYIFASIDYTDLDTIVNTGPLFNDICPINGEFFKDSNIPGIIIYSKRSKPLSSWMDGIEIFSFECDIEQKNLVIECGLETQYLFGKMSDEQIQEAKLFEINKKKCNGYHFIAIQSNSDGEEIDGFWFLKS